MKKLSSVQQFENLVKKSLLTCIETSGECRKDFSSLTLGAAVSGGADSMALLCALLSIAGTEKVKVITIDHNIRSSEESAGDASFVEDFCAHRGVFCKKVVFPRGEVSSVCRERGLGTEEAARFLRYNAFEQFSRDCSIDFLCLAHNQNDQCETVLMRFLKGSGCEGLGGIPRVRGKIIRPLLDVSRSAIEVYLSDLSVSWRTDKTNFENMYARNKIRNILVPVLDDLFPGWQKSVLAGSSKALSDEQQISLCLKNAPEWTKRIEKRTHRSTPETVELSMNWQDFLSMSESLQRRRLYEVSDCLQQGKSNRLSYLHITQILALKEDTSKRVTFDGLEIFVKNNVLFIKKMQKTATESGFLAIIQKAGVEYLIPSCRSVFSVSTEGFLCVRMEGRETVKLCRASLPLCIRSVQSADSVTACDGQERSVLKLLSSWHVSVTEKNTVPVVQELNNSKIIAVCGCAAGKENWIDKDYV